MLSQSAIVESLSIGAGEEGPGVADEGEGVLGEGEVVGEWIEEEEEFVELFPNEGCIVGYGVELEDGVPVGEVGVDGVIGGNEDVEDGKYLVRPTEVRMGE